MIKKLGSVVVGIVFVSQCFSQDQGGVSKISPDELREDFMIAWSSLKNHHSGVYDFTSKAEFDSIAQVFHEGLSDSLTEAEFHVYLRKFTQHVKCGHTVAFPSTSWYSSLRRKENKVPVHVFVWQDQLYINKTIGDSTLNLAGSKILSINGRKAQFILSEMGSIVGRDGLGETMVRRNTEYLFQTYYVYLFGVADNYFFELEKPNGDTLTVNLPGSHARRVGKHKELALRDEMKNRGMSFGMIEGSEKYAALDLNNFSSKGYKKFYRQTFKELNKMDSVDLILDLRGNGGGYFPHGNLLLRYLMNDAFTMDFSKSKKSAKKGKYMKMKLSSKFTRFIFSTIPDRNKEDPDRNYQIRFKPLKRNHFDGEIFVLTDGWTFSAGSFVASKLKNGAGVTIIGEETGGGEVGFNAVLESSLELPNSHIRIVIPMYHVDIQPKMEDIGRGVIPDVQIDYSLEERIMGKTDLEIRYILEGF